MTYPMFYSSLLLTILTDPIYIVIEWRSNFLDILNIKDEIAHRLLPRQLEEAGLDDETPVPGAGVEGIIREYTYEAGVRN
jgi:hypothetical protein